jgi:hypothetical protein
MSETLKHKTYHLNADIRAAIFFCCLHPLDVCSLKPSERLLTLLFLCGLLYCVLLDRLCGIVVRRTTGHGG